MATLESILTDTLTPWVNGGASYEQTAQLAAKAALRDIRQAVAEAGGNAVMTFAGGLLDSDDARIIANAVHRAIREALGN